VSLNISFDYSRVDWSDPSYRIASGIFFVFGIESSINWILVIVEKLTVYTVFLTTLQVKVLAFAFFFAALYLLLLFRNKLIRFDSQSLQFSARQNFDFTFHFLPFFVLFFQGQNWDNKLIFFFVPGIIIANVLPTLIRLPMLLCTFYLTDIWPLSKDFAIFEITQLLGDLCVYALVIFGSIFLTLSYTNLISRRIGLSLKVLFR
jgi:hypothetical protein